MIGAFGAHALQAVLMENGRVDTFETGVKYQAMHAMALLVMGVLSGTFNSKWIGAAAIATVVGILIFSGSLYILSVTNVTWLGAITPIGGLSLMAGWLLLIAAIAKR
jgi:uncharacterized membrane protein YgdD (TMEM256/DUF423 family)